MSRSGTLSWPQQRQWLNMGWRLLDEQFPVYRFGWEVESTATVGTVAMALRQNVADHEILRTTLGIGASGEPLQFVGDDLDFEMTVHDLAAFEDNAREPAIPLFAGLPVGRSLWRADLYAEGVYVRIVVITAEHIVFDTLGVENWKRQFGRIIADEPHLAGKVLHPLDGRNQARGAGRGYQLDTAAEDRRPQITVPAVAPVLTARYLVSVATYPTMLPLVDRAAVVHNCSRSMISMLSLGLLLAHHARQEVVYLDIITNDKSVNEESIDCRFITVNVPVEIDGEATIRHQIQKISDVLLSSYLVSEAASPIDMLEARLRYAIDRNIALTPTPQFNFVGPSWPLQIDGAVGWSGIDDVSIGDTWSEESEPYTNLFTFAVDQHLVKVTFDLDAKMMARGSVHQMLRCLPALVNEIGEYPDRAINDMCSLGLVDPFDNHGMVRLGPNWVSIKEIESILRGLPGVCSAAAKVAADGALIASLVTENGVTGQRVHERVLAVLPERTDVIAPHRYELTSVDGASACEFFEPCGGSAGDAECTRTLAERAVATAFEKANGHEPKSLDVGYFAAGGRLINVPLFIDAVQRSGYAGLMPYHILAPGTLRMLAGAVKLTVMPS